MIIYEQNKNTIVAKFSQEGKTIQGIWEDSLTDIAYKYLAGTGFLDWNYINAVVPKVLKDRRLVGIAKCHPNDSFNLEEGKRVAREDLINRFNLAKTQLKKEILYVVKHDVQLIRDRM
jgi:hypothetical protein